MLRPTQRAGQHGPLREHPLQHRAPPRHRQGRPLWGVRQQVRGPSGLSNEKDKCQPVGSTSWLDAARTACAAHTEQCSLAAPSCRIFQTALGRSMQSGTPRPALTGLSVCRPQPLKVQLPVQGRPPVPHGGAPRPAGHPPGPGRGLCGALRGATAGPAAGHRSAAAHYPAQRGVLPRQPRPQRQPSEHRPRQLSWQGLG